MKRLSLVLTILIIKLFLFLTPIRTMSFNGKWTERWLGNLANRSTRTLGFVRQCRHTSPYDHVLVRVCNCWRCVWCYSGDENEEEVNLCKRKYFCDKDKVERNTNLCFQCTGGILSATSCIASIVWYNNYIVVIVGRCIAGLMHGILCNAIITHAAENVVKEIRGMLLSSINSMMSAGVFTATIIIATVTYGDDGAFNSDRVLGMLGLSFSMLGILCTMFLTYESIPYLLRKGKDSEAVVNMLKLRNESALTMKLTHDLDELRLMVTEDAKENSNIFSNGNVWVVAKMVGLHMLGTVTDNFLLNVVMMALTMRVFDKDIYNVSAIILTGTRFAGSIFAVFTTDFIRRKVHLTGSGVVCAILMLVLAITVISIDELVKATVWIPMTLCIAFQLFASIGIDPMKLIFLSEAFSTPKKAWSIACVVTCENIFQIVSIGLFFVDGITYVTMVTVLFTTAGLMFALIVVLQLSIPETLNLTIREARDLFRDR